MEQPINNSYVLSKGEGKSIWFLGTLIEVKATGEETGGKFGLIEELNPPGDGPPLHIHHNEDETFYIVEGEVTFVCGEKTMRATPGAYVFMPRGVPHTYKVEGTQPARMLTMNVPAGIEQFFIELGTPTQELTLPPNTVTTDIEKMYALAKKYNVEILNQAGNG